MKFGTAKAASMGMLLAALAIGVASLFMFEEGSSAYMGSAVLLIILLFSSVAIMIIWGRCPYCGKRLFYSLYKWKNCPKCRKALKPGDKYSPASMLKKRR
ncbi:MAG: hypothetical protein IJZ91_03600 [Oscillospiraceae bacterium]|nr:hypothetical protein [Oscillospiraceae bacterium]